MTYQVMKAPVLSTAHISMESDVKLGEIATLDDLTILMPEANEEEEEVEDAA